jgi:hypothetical protein
MILAVATVIVELLDERRAESIDAYGVQFNNHGITYTIEPDSVVGVREFVPYHRIQFVTWLAEDEELLES